MRISDWSSDVCSSDLQTSQQRIISTMNVVPSHFNPRVHAQRPQTRGNCRRANRGGTPSELRVSLLRLRAWADACTGGAGMWSNMQRTLTVGSERAGHTSSAPPLQLRFSCVTLDQNVLIRWKQQSCVASVPSCKFEKKKRRH